MPDTYHLLLILQSCSLSISFGLALLLYFARFHQPDTSKEYEQMRWCNMAALMLMAVHYILQIHFGFRAQGADVGALVNMLFYAPTIYIFCYSFIRLAGRRSFQRRYILISAACMLLIVGCFVGGYLYYNSLHMSVALYAMGIIFTTSIVYCYQYSFKEIRRMQQLVDEESGRMQVQYNLFLHTGSNLLYAATLLMSLSIYFTPLVFLVGTLNLVAILFFVVSFIALGFNISTVSQITSVEMEEEVSVNKTKCELEVVKPTLSPEQSTMLRELLNDWRKKQGYATSELNSTTLATRLNVPKRVLVQYLREAEGKTFRIWLSDLRLEEAKRLIIEHPEYTNEAIAESCGFSRSHLQVKFKEATGFTTNDWRSAHAQNEDFQ